MIISRNIIEYYPEGQIAFLSNYYEFIHVFFYNYGNCYNRFM